MEYFEVTNKDELMAAWAKVHKADTIIRITDMIDLEGKPLIRIEHEHELTITCDGGAGVSFGITHTTEDKDQIAGLGFGGRSLDIIGGTWADFNANGQAIWLDGAHLEQATLRGLSFRNVGQVSYPPLMTPIMDRHSIVATQGIFGHAPLAEVRISSCLWTNCQRNNGSNWSHGIYCYAKKIIVSDCQFYRCGSPLAVAGSKFCLVTRCRIDEPQLCLQDGRGFGYSYVWAINKDHFKQKPEENVFWGFYAIDNEIIGPVNVYASLDGVNPHQRFDNDIDRMSTNEPFAKIGGNWVTREEWQAAGRDV